MTTTEPRWGEGIVSPAKSPAITTLHMSDDELAEAKRREETRPTFGFARALDEDDDA